MFKHKLFKHKRARLALALILAALSLLPVTSVSAASASTTTALSMCQEAIPFNASNFSHPTRIDNQWLPLVPGTQLILDGFVNGAAGPVPHRVVLTVTDLTKVVDGVRNVVLWDRDFTNGQLQESELAFFAQDDQGNVWNLGEYPEEYDAGVFAGAPSTWIADQDGARGGLQMRADPRVGTPSYLQAVSRKVGLLDCGQVFKAGLSVSVPARSYSSVLAINEWSPLDKGSGIQRKFFAPGVGNVQITAVDDPQGETLKLTRIVHLAGQPLAEVRAEALNLDAHAYQVSKVYRATQPAQ